MAKILTLAYLVTDDSVCVAMKKRGFGEGNWNGYGVRQSGGLSQEVACYFMSEAK